MRHALIALLFACASILSAQVQIGGTGVQIGGTVGSTTISLTTTGTSGAASLTGTVLNIPQYQCAITLTTTGSSGAATLNSCTLNIPQYAGSGMVYPAESGIPVVSGGAAWGTTLIASTFGAFLSSLSGCSTTTNAYSPASSQCFPPGSGINPNMVVSTTNYTPPSANIWVRMNIGSSNATLTLPAGACNTITGWNVLVELSASSSGTVTIAANGNSYDGVTTLGAPGQAFYIGTDGSTCHSLLFWSALPVAANVVTMANPANSSNRIVESAGANKTTVALDYPWVLVIPAANCNNATAAAGWSLPASGAPTAACRTGTNTNGGVLQFAASNTAQFQVELPGDYDSTGTVYAKIYLTQGANTTSGQTIIMQLQTACASATDDPAFNTAQAFSTATTVGTAQTAFTPTLSAVTMTGCAAGNPLNIKVSRSGSDTASTSPNVYFVTLTIPRTPTMQAN
jgi:hypothetical protein